MRPLTDAQYRALDGMFGSEEVEDVTDDEADILSELKRDGLVTLTVFLHEDGDGLVLHWEPDPERAEVALVIHEAFLASQDGLAR